MHFLAGGIILALGPIQLFARVREWAPRFHHWTGRLCITTTFLAGVGGLLFIALEGTLGGLPMDLGFGLYGVLMIWASIETYRHGRARRINRHRAWGMRLFSLAIALFSILSAACRRIFIGITSSSFNPMPCPPPS